MVLVTGLIAALAGWVLVRATIGRAPAGSAAAGDTRDVADDSRADDGSAASNTEATNASNTEAANATADGQTANAVANGDVANGEGANVDAANADAANAEGANAAANAEDANADADGEPTRDDAIDPADTRATTSAGAMPNAGTSTTVRRGRVAYIRCGETERCPRDAALEDATWAILEALPSCARLAGQAGSADVRIHFEAESAEVRFRDHGDRPLSIPALRGCLVGPATALRTTLTPRPLTASFRFDLVAE